MIVYCVFCAEGGGEMVCEKCVERHPAPADCPGDECEVCSVRECPFEDTTHYNKDGCTSCGHEPALCPNKMHSGWRRKEAECPDPECVVKRIMNS